jgi:hypothetical protein
MPAKWSEVRAEAITGDESVSLDPANYYGFSFRETSGSATATIRIYDSDTATGDLLDSVQLAAGESAREYYAAGVRAQNGIYVDVVSGAVEGSIRVERVS